jgi:hypothetical protein
MATSETNLMAMQVLAVRKVFHPHLKPRLTPFTSVSRDG